VSTPPQWINGVELADVQLRRGAGMQLTQDGTPLGGRAGVLPGGADFTVAVAGTSLTVGPGRAWLTASGQGAYQAVMPATRTLTRTAAHATLTRIDLVYLRVWDNAVDGSGLTQADVVYLAGTASSSPQAPTPSGTVIYIPLATITVPSVSAGGSPSVSTAIRPATVAPGGILPATTAPSVPYVGQPWHDGTDLHLWNGTAWDTYQKVTTVPWITPDLATTSPAYSGDGNSNGPVQYRIVNEQGTAFAQWSGGLNIPYASGSPANEGNFLAAALPANARPTSKRSVTVACSAASSTSLSVKVDFNPDGSVGIVAASGVQPPWLSLNDVKYRLV
jgi:hypothetical protein